MKVTSSTVIAALAAGTLAAPHKRAACSSAVKLDAKSNVWKNYKLHANTYYRDEVNKAAEAISDASLKASALKVADVGSFLWM